MHDSLFLMERPSFIEGMARVLDLGDTMTEYNSSPSGDEADHAANWSDWALIAADMRRAAQQYVAGIGHVAAQQAR